MSRRYDLRRLHRSRSFTSLELAGVLGISITTVRRWCMEGLEPIDCHRPYLFQGEQVAKFLRQRSTPRFKLAPGELLCIACRTGRPPRNGLMKLEPRGPTTVDLVGYCAVSGHKMFRRVRISQLAEKMGPARIAREDEIATMSNSGDPDRVQSFEAKAA